MKTNLFSTYQNLSAIRRKKVLDLFNKLSSKGFTLIELLIVIAILGVLAAGILIAIDPVEQLARGRDSGRKASIGQLGRATQAYYTAHVESTNPYPLAAGWNTTLLNSGEIKVFPNHPDTSPLTTCTGGGVLATDFCYKVNSTQTEVIIFTHLESKSERTKFLPTCASIATAWYLYSTSDGRAGTWCGVEPGVPATGVSMGVNFH